MDQPDLRSAENYINRELSLLEFNERVLAQALDERVPLLERLKFLCISSNNLDEFFEIRVAGLKQRIELGSDQPGRRRPDASPNSCRRFTSAPAAWSMRSTPASTTCCCRRCATRASNYSRAPPGTPRPRSGSSSTSNAKSSRCCRRSGSIRRGRFRASRTRA